MRTLDDAAREAVEAHRRLLCKKAIELALGEMVALDGVPEVRKMLLRIVRSLRYY